jgi:hypothetical protein
VNHRPTVPDTVMMSRPFEGRPLEGRPLEGRPLEDRPSQRALTRCLYRLIFRLLTWLAV